MNAIWKLILMLLSWGFVVSEPDERCKDFNGTFAVIVPHCTQAGGKLVLERDIQICEGKQEALYGASETVSSHQFGKYTHNAIIQGQFGLDISSSCAVFKLGFKKMVKRPNGRLYYAMPLTSDGELIPREIDPVVFEGLDMCDNIVLYRIIEFRIENMNEQSCTSMGHNVEYKKKQDLCQLSFQRTQVKNPFQIWMEKKLHDETFPLIQPHNSSALRISWGDAKYFGCRDQVSEGKITLYLNNESSRTHSFNINLSEENFVDVRSMSESDHRCFAKEVIVQFTLTSANYIQAYSSNQWFQNHCSYGRSDRYCINYQDNRKDMVSKSKVIGKALKEDTMKQRITIEGDRLVVPQDDEYSPCIKEARFKSNADPYGPLEVILDLSQALFQECEEKVGNIRVIDVQGHDVFTYDLIHLPKIIDINVDEDTINVDIEGQYFENCNLQIRLDCNGTVHTFRNKTFSTEDLHGQTCKAMVFTLDRHGRQNLFFNDTRQWSAFFKIEPGRTSPTLTASLAIASAVLVMIMIVVVVGIALKRKKLPFQKRHNVLSIKHGRLPPHAVFMKDDEILENLDFFLEFEYQITDEYRKLESIVASTIASRETTFISSSELNIKRNRYKDMLPYDSNLISLNTPTGKPPSNYINASWIKFESLDEKFIAAQAPKPSMFDGFWQMVLEQEVTIIVMITALEEEGKIKAHQYWPTEEKPKIRFKNNIKIKLIDINQTEDQNMITVVVSKDEGKQREVTIIQELRWNDNQAPSDTAVLIDLRAMVDELKDNNPGRILVHCSAGVGRTGTFIAFYKLAKDFNNDKIDTLDPMGTVYEMREQRMKTVQKPIQYFYLIRCLADFIRGECSDSVDYYDYRKIPTGHVDEHAV